MAVSVTVRMTSRTDLAAASEDGKEEEEEEEMSTLTTRGVGGHNLGPLPDITNNNVDKGA